MSAQSFYMFIQQYIDAWLPPARMAAAQTRALAAEVVAELFSKIAVSYPVLREEFVQVTATILEKTEEKCIKLLEALILREKDPFTINEFLQAHINKLRYDRFESAVQSAFTNVAAQEGGISGGGSWQAAKEHVASAMRSWYRDAHGVSSAANAQDMAAILEAYWTLASKRFVDNACMTLDQHILSTLGPKLQEQCYQFVHNEQQLESFFTEDPKIVAKRKDLIQLRDRLVKANTAMASIQAHRAPPPRHSTGSRQPDSAHNGISHGDISSVGGQLIRITIDIGKAGLGLQLADEGGRVVVRGFRPGSPAQQAGMNLGDILLEINGAIPGTFMGTIQKLKSLGPGPVHLALDRGTAKHISPAAPAHLP